MRPAGGLLLAVLLLGHSIPAAGQEQEQVRILVPAFSGDPQLGKTTSNLLRLQVSQTFQEAGTGTRAVMIFDDKPLAVRSHEAAEGAGVRLGTLAHLVLWGQSYAYPDGVVVVTHLSTTPWLYEGRAERPELWTLSIGNGAVAIRSELPRPVYEFPPVQLSSSAASHYRDMDGLIIYRDRGFKNPVGRFRDVFRALRYEGDAVYLESNGSRGWVPLPHLLDSRSEVVNFVGGYIRVLRGDWDGAVALLAPLAGRSDLTPEVATDTQVFLGLAEERRNRSGLRYFQKAVEINPYDRGVVSYLLMSRVAEALRASGPERAGRVQALREEISERSYLYSGNSAWLAQIRKAAELLSATSP